MARHMAVDHRYHSLVRSALMYLVSREAGPFLLFVFLFSFSFRVGGIGVLEKVSDHPRHLHFSAGNLEARCDEAGAVYVTDPLDNTYDTYLTLRARTSILQ